MWTEIKTSGDTEKFIERFDGLCGSVIKEIHYLGGCYVDNDLSVFPLNVKSRVSLVIQRQSDDPSMLIMEFSGVGRMRLNPVPDDIDCEIQRCTLTVIDGMICFCDGETEELSDEVWTEPRLTEEERNDRRLDLIENYDGMVYPL